MKAILLAVVLGLTASAASADTYSGPPGMYDQPANLEQAPPPPPARRVAAQRPNNELRAAIIARFDRDGDGRLNPQEKRQAIRALKRMARRLKREAKRQQRRAGQQQPQQGDFDIDIDIR